MSRLIVKGLPDRMTEVRLTDLFKKYGDITNVQLKYTPQGKFRKFGFVGFKTNDSAEAAIKELDKTFVEGSKLGVEVCAKLGDPGRKTWSKYSRQNEKEPEKPKVKVEDGGKKKKKKPSPDDPEYAEYQEFMALHKKKSERQKWADGVGVTEGDSDEAAEEEEQRDSGVEESDLQFLKSKKVTKLDEEEEPEEESADEATEEVNEGKKKKLKYGALPTVKLRGLPYKCQKGDIKKFFLPLKPFHVRMPKVHGVHGIAFVTFKTPEELHKALKKHRSFLEGKRILVTRKEQSVLEVKEEKFQRVKKLEEKLLAEEEPVGESGRIFVRNLPYSTTEEDIEEIFKPYGELTEVHMPINQKERRNMGLAFVSFLFPEHAAKAFQELDGEIFQGRILHLLPAKPSRPMVENQEDDSTYKAKKKKELKSTAMGAQHSWNTLFLGANAVVDVMADKYKVSKKRVLDSGGDTSAAVRTALGETQLVAETRKFLVENGVSLDAFSRPPKKRSRRVILAKNLPAGTQAEKLQEKFAKFGLVEKLILPPTGVTAIIVMDNPAEARTAFKTLAYSNLNHTPLYLEWAPEDVFQLDAEVKEGEVKKEDLKVKGETVEEPPVVDEEPPEPETTVFVKNVNFETTDEKLREHFKKCGKIHSATISRKPDPKRKGETLSMGFGFVQYKKRASAQKALKELQHSRLDDHPLELKLSHRTSSAQTKTGARKTTEVGPMSVPKILVRNIPFQANQREVLDLFKTFGEVQAVRLPKKPGQQEHRGFGFVHFASQEAAKRAFEAMVHSTHLYGRRLVLEWAKGEETVSDIRKRTASHYVAGSSKSKKSSKGLGLDNDGDEGE